MRITIFPQKPCSTCSFSPHPLLDYTLIVSTPIFPSPELPFSPTSTPATKRRLQQRHPSYVHNPSRSAIHLDGSLWKLEVLREIQFVLAPKENSNSSSDTSYALIIFIDGCDMRVPLHLQCVSKLKTIVQRLGWTPECCCAQNPNLVNCSHNNNIINEKLDMERHSSPPTSTGFSCSPPSQPFTPATESLYAHAKSQVIEIFHRYVMLPHLSSAMDSPLPDNPSSSSFSKEAKSYFPESYQHWSTVSEWRRCERNIKDVEEEIGKMQVGLVVDEVDGISVEPPHQSFNNFFEVDGDTYSNVPEQTVESESLPLLSPSLSSSLQQPRTPMQRSYSLDEPLQALPRGASSSQPKLTRTLSLPSQITRGFADLQLQMIPDDFGAFTPFPSPTTAWVPNISKTLTKFKEKYAYLKHQRDRLALQVAKIEQDARDRRKREEDAIAARKSSQNAKFNLFPTNDTSNAALISTNTNTSTNTTTTTSSSLLTSTSSSSPFSSEGISNILFALKGRNNNKENIREKEKGSNTANVSSRSPSGGEMSREDLDLNRRLKDIGPLRNIATKPAAGNHQKTKSLGSAIPQISINSIGWGFASSPSNSTKEALESGWMPDRDYFANFLQPTDSVIAVKEVDTATTGGTNQIVPKVTAKDATRLKSSRTEEVIQMAPNTIYDHPVLGELDERGEFKVQVSTILKDELEGLMEVDYGVENNNINSNNTNNNRSSSDGGNSTWSVGAENENQKNKSITAEKKLETKTLTSTKINVVLSKGSNTRRRLFTERNEANVSPPSSPTRKADTASPSPYKKLRRSRSLPPSLLVTDFFRVSSNVAPSALSMKKHTARSPSTHLYRAFSSPSLVALTAPTKTQIARSQSTPSSFNYANKHIAVGKRKGGEGRENNVIRRQGQLKRIGVSRSGGISRTRTLSEHGVERLQGRDDENSDTEDEKEDENTFVDWLVGLEGRVRELQALQQSLQSC